MSTIKIEDIAHVRFAAPDLEKMRIFLLDFGLDVQVVQNECLYARGKDGTPFNHVTKKGKSGFQALGLRAKCIDDLYKLSEAEGVDVESLNEPGGGHVVRLVDPDGILVEVVAGQTRNEIESLPAEVLHNSVHSRLRQRSRLNLKAKPSTVVRLGHCVLNVSNFRKSERWYKERFGFITSDEIEASPNVSVGAFMRCDRGDLPTDHHTLFLTQLPQKNGFLHAAFEVTDLDDLILGHEHLSKQKYKASWGIGRHVLGSQVFDYWRDPWGHELEHWTDGDLFTAQDGSSKATITDLLDVQWGAVNPVRAGRLAPSSKMVSYMIALNAKMRRFFKN